MDELNELLRPTWGSEQWIMEGWNQITQEEKNQIKSRIDQLFKDGLPIKLKHDKLAYIYTFSLLAQLEVLAIQVPLKFEAKMVNPEHKKLMRLQLVDEIFHGLVFTKIVYQLCEPHAQPPKYSGNIESLCNFIRQEECPKVAVVLLNLVAEGWIEEIFKCFQNHEIAPKLFSTIMNDERRHVCEADLYREIGLPDKHIVGGKIKYLEKQLLINILLQYKYMASVTTILGVQGVIDFLQDLDKKHNEQLNKIKLKPSQNWQMLMKIAYRLYSKVSPYTEQCEEIELSPLRKVLLSQWQNPVDPTMVGNFNINISCLDLFNKKYSPSILTIILLQTISLTLNDNPAWRIFLSNLKMHQVSQTYAGLIVKLPNCDDHIGTIVYENCHEITAEELTLNIRTSIKIMVYCYNKRKELETAYPHLVAAADDMLYDFVNDIYEYPLLHNPLVSLSNLTKSGFSQGKSPLRPNETIKFTVFEFEKKQVWNQEKQEFEVQDLLPVSVSADHRVYDGNAPLPQEFRSAFERIVNKMIADDFSKEPPRLLKEDFQLAIQFLDKLILTNLELGYKILTILQTTWPSFLSFEELFNVSTLVKLKTEPC